MTTTETPTTVHRTETAGARAAGTGLIAAAVLVAAGILTTPPGSTGGTRDQVEAYVDHPVLTQVSAVLLHVGYLLVLPGVVALLGIARGRARRLSLTGASLAFVGFVSLSGNVLIDIVTLGAGRELGTARAAAAVDAAGELPGALVFIIPAFLFSFVGLAVLMVALGRAGELAWVWVTLTLVGLVLVFAAPLHAVTVAGFLALCGGLAAAGVRLRNS